jgi:hypothetical protein
MEKQGEAGKSVAPGGGCRHDWGRTPLQVGEVPPPWEGEDGGDHHTLAVEEG